MEGRKQFTFYRSFCKSIDELKPKDQYAVLRAIMHYGLDGIEPDNLNSAQRSVFYLIQPVLDTGRKRASAGRIGGSKRKAKPKQIVSEGEKETEIEVENEIEIEIDTEDECLKGTDGFEIFWNEYPVKVGMEKAREAWDGLAHDLDTVMQGVQRWKASREWAREDGRFIPRAWRWLAEERYLEHPDPEKKPIWGASGVLGKAELESIARVMED